METGPFDKREWLAARGLAKPGTRGRFSLDAKEALAKAESEGVRFLEKTQAIATVRVVDENGDNTFVKTNVDPFAPHKPALRTGILTFVNGKDKIAVNASEACEKCAYSFGWCWCDAPTFRLWSDGREYVLSE